LSGKAVPPGTSGGVTLIGCAGGLLGASTVVFAASLASGEPGIVFPGLTMGMAGMFLDSLMGGSIQACFHCNACNAPFEQVGDRRLDRVVALNSGAEAPPAATH
jgi:uncharacterized membrane protein